MKSQNSAEDDYQVVQQAQLNSRKANAKITSILEAHTHRAYDNIFYDEAWRNLPEIPSKSEIMPSTQSSRAANLPAEEWNDYQQDSPLDPNLPHNIIDGPWSSKVEYLGTHYQILRKNATLPLQRAVERFQRTPLMMDDRETCIYTNVTFKGLFCSNTGVATRIEFSTDRSPKRVRWEQSRRLAQGVMVALSPMKDGFTKICKVAVVAARPIEGGLNQNPPQIDLFWGDLDDAVFDPVEKYIMVESRLGYFEANRHMLVAIQKLMTERFYLARHLVSLENEIEAPDFLQNNPVMDLSSLIDSESELERAAAPCGAPREEDLLCNVDVLSEWPDITYSTLDHSQLRAYQDIVSKRLAIIQGPPGTGKTHVSVTALRAMLASQNVDGTDPPIIIACQTNHALDQMLNHVLKFEKDVLRLGSRVDKVNEEIISRTIYQLRAASKGAQPAKIYGSVMAAWKRESQTWVNKIMATMLPMMNGQVLTSDVLLEHGIISETQRDSLSAEGWSNGGDRTVTDVPEWLGPDQLTQVPFTPPIVDELEIEEIEDEHERLLALGLENEEYIAPQGSKQKDALAGEYLPFNRRVTGRHTAISTLKLKKLLGKRNLFDIPVAYRGTIYRSWEQQLNEKMLKELKVHLKDYQAACNRLKVSREFANIKLVQGLKVKLIACTTTGLSKYRGFLSAFQPRTLMIEEAAETLEGTVIAGMFDSLEQLILVGDHKQLRANVDVAELAGEPYHLSISMFERLVNNSIPFVMLNRQRRMAPEIRQLLTIHPPIGTPFYSNLYDHECVQNTSAIVNRPPVDGMGKYSTWFCHHNFPENKNADGSFFNSDEAEMVAGFYNYLVLNGNDPSNITILAFYNGQRKTILQELRKIANLRNHGPYKVFTVDSYQGEENDIVILSLVRCNSRGNIGFLTNHNRVVVALSRARRGFYLFGSITTLIHGEELSPEFSEYESIQIRTLLWKSIIAQLGQQRRLDVDRGLPITCQRHKEITHIYEPGDWAKIAGGCHQRCGELLSCGHVCPYTCHPFNHEMLECQEPCSRIVAMCGHACSSNCGASCYCVQCKVSNMLSQASSARMLTDAYGNDATQAAPASLSGSGILGPSDMRNQKYRSPSASPTKRFGTRLTAETSPKRAFEATCTANDWAKYSGNVEAEDKILRAETLGQKEPKVKDTVFDETYVETTLDEYGKRVVVSCANTEIPGSTKGSRKSAENLNDFPELLTHMDQLFTKPRPFRHTGRVTGQVLKILAPDTAKTKKPASNSTDTLKVRPTKSQQRKLVNGFLVSNPQKASLAAQEMAESMDGMTLASSKRDDIQQQFIGNSATMSGQLLDIPVLQLQDRDTNDPARLVNLLDMDAELVIEHNLKKASDETRDLVDF